MPRTPGPRSSLSVALALVAATAVGLALDRTYLPDLLTRSTSNAWDRAALVAIGLAPCVAMWALALLAFRLIRSVADWRRSDRRPGGVTALAIALVRPVPAPANPAPSSHPETGDRHRLSAIKVVIALSSS
jgi:hypothetical protein